MALYQIVKALVLPPACLCLALIAALLLSLRWQRLGLGLIWTITIIFYLLAAPFSSNWLARSVATIPPLVDQAALKDVQAIVVLSAGAFPNAPEYDGVMPDRATLERVRYAAHLYRRTPLPILVSGGAIQGLSRPLADIMKEILEEDFAVPVKWVEDHSRDTIENARFSSAMLKQDGITSIALVTSAAHMPRASALFREIGFTVVPAPTGFPSANEGFPADFIPRMAALDQSETSIYELLAHGWHTVRPQQVTSTH